MLSAHPATVIHLRPANESSVQYLALTLGNGARHTRQSLNAISMAGAGLPALGQDLESLADDATVLTCDLQDVLAQIDHVRSMWAELKDL